MPIYDFRCRECGRVSDNMERLISASYMIKTNASAPGTTYCGRTEHCETLPALQRAYAAESKGIYADISSGGL